MIHMGGYHDYRERYHGYREGVQYRGGTQITKDDIPPQY